jgi:DNA polymerase-1
MPGFDLSIPDGEWIHSEHEARQWINRYLVTAKQNGGLGIDSETTGLDRVRDSVIIWSLSDYDTRICLDRKYLPLFREPLLENPEIDFDFTNAKFDAHMFANSGVDLTKAGQWRDTIVMSWLRNENNVGRHGLKECTLDLFNRTTPTFEQTFGKIQTTVKKGEVKKTVGQMIRDALEDPARREYVIDYASLDAYNTTALRRRFEELLDEERIGWGTLKDYFYMFEVPFTKVLYKMERRGITVDKGYLSEKRGPMEARMSELETEFIRERNSGLPEGVEPKQFKLKSPAHMRTFFFTHLKKESIKKTKGGKSGIKQDSTDVEVLETWAGEGDEWAMKFLEYRGVQKIHGTYIKGLSACIDEKYRIHTTLNQSGTVTGRLSSSEPNLQNLPRPEEDEFRIRESFIAGEGKVLLVADYEQLEMRLMAHFSGDSKMIDTIRSGKDIHSLTTAEIEMVPYDEVVEAKKVKKKEDLTDRQKELLLKRQNNKGTGFGIIYGIGGPKLANKLTRDTKKFVSEDEGDQLIEKWLSVFPGVKRYIAATKNIMRQQGYVQVFTGRKRRFGEVRMMSRKDASQADRQGVNSIIQGTAAEIAKVAMIRAESDPLLNNLGAMLLLQIHDELIFEVPNDEAVIAQCTERVKEIMEHPFHDEFAVPLPVSIASAYSWADAK